MKTHFYTKCSSVFVVLILFTTNLLAQEPEITGPISVATGSTGVVYNAPTGMGSYAWLVSGGALIDAGQSTEAITVTWINPGAWTVSVTYTDLSNVSVQLSLNVNVGPTITGPMVNGLPATLKDGITPDQVYTTEPGMTEYYWTVSPKGTITAGDITTNSITVTWTDPQSQQSVSVNYRDKDGYTAAFPTVLIINYYPFADAIDPTIIPKFVDPLPHFAGGLRVNAKAGGSMTITTRPITQVALSTGTVLTTGTIGTTPGAGVGNYAGYEITYNGTIYDAMWPARTIETQQGFPLTVQYVNGLGGVRYRQFNILADQTLMMNGYTPTGNSLTDPYDGEIPMVVHLHGGEMPSGSDGGPNSWFTADYAQTGPGFQYNASSLATYPNMQEAATLWYHPHDDGLTRINVYTGLAGYYFLRGNDEEAAKLPGWTGDGLVQEVTPAGKSATFYPGTPYLPEVEIAIQDRMFNHRGELYWPVAPTNPEIHPFWTPEFVGDVMTVNGKSWPYLSVAPRKYRFRFLEGCNARFLNMWLAETINADGTTATYGPKITVIGGEGGLLAAPVDLVPSAGGTLLMAPGQRYDVIIDFTGLEGKTFTLMNDAGAPYPGGDPVTSETSQIMQFVVNGTLAGADNSLLPANLRPVTPLVQLTDFAGNLSAGVTPYINRQIILNEISADGGPASVLVNNTYFDAALAVPGTSPIAGGPSELQLEGTTETVKIINVSADAHPIHIHLLQWQLVSRQTIDDVGYLNAYAGAWAANGSGATEFPAGQGYPGGAGPPSPYGIPNADGALGGNPAITPFLTGVPVPARPEERGWKDNIIVMPGEVTTFVVRIAPTDRPINAGQNALLFPFDPSEGPGYVWHCHIVDHEDMSMMRPLPILPSPARKPQITSQPISATACAGDIVTYSITLGSTAGTTFQWQESTTGGATWTNLTNVAPYTGALTSSLTISPVPLGLSANRYRCVLTNNSGVTNSDGASLTVNDCFIQGTLKNNNSGLAGFTVTANGKTSQVTGLDGAFTIPGVSSGVHPVTITAVSAPAVGGINSTDARSVNSWALVPTAIPNVQYLAGDVDNTTLIDALDAQAIQQNFVMAKPFIKASWVFSEAAGTPGTVNPTALSAIVPGNAVTGFDILGMCTGDFNGSFGTNVSNITFTNTANTLSFPAGKQFDLPINAGSTMTVGAVSLVLNIPSNLVTVKNVRIQGSTGPVTYKVAGNELRIGWFAATPVTATLGQPFVILTLMPTSAFNGTTILTIGMPANPLNEIVGADNLPIVGAALTVDNVKLIASNTPALQVSASPNPTKGATTITYTLPVDGTVNLGIYSSTGILMQSVLSNAVGFAGTYQVSVTLTVAKGTYYIILTLNDGINPLMTTSIKLVKSK